LIQQGHGLRLNIITAFNEMNKIEFGSDYEGISALGVGQDRYLYIVVL
jgi:hypothetical protein